MHNFVMICLFAPSFFGVIAQPCNMEKGLSEIEKLYQEGYFNRALNKTVILEDCTSITTQQYRDLLILKYKCLRNIRKGRKSQASLEKLKAYLAAKNVPLDFEIQFLLAEMYALGGKKEEHSYYIQKIEDSIMSNPHIKPAHMGRFYLVKYYGFEREESYGDALANAQKALAHFQKMEDPPVYYMGNTLRGLGNMNRNHGDFDKSISYYEQELQLYEAHFTPDHFDIAVCHFNIGNVHYEKLEYQAALDRYLKTRKIWIGVFDPQDAYMRLLNEAIGDMYWELDDPENALTYFNYSIEGQPQINNDTSENTLKAADSVLQSGNYASAINYYEEAFKWREKTYGKEHSLTGACKNFVARAVRSTGNTLEALKAYQEAIGILVEEIEGDDIYINPGPEMHIRSYQYLLESLMAKGELMRELYLKTQNTKDLIVALQTHEAAIRILEEMKNGHMSETSKVFWTQRTLSLIENSIETATKLYERTSDEGYLEKAFIFSEKSKALLLLASFENNEKGSFVNVPQTILAEEKELKNNITTYIGKLESEEKRCAEVRDKMLNLYQGKLRSLQTDYDLLLNQIRKDYPDYYDLKYETKIATLAEIRKSILDKNTTLVSYFMGDQQGYVFYVTIETITIRKIDDVKELIDNVSWFFSLINTRSSFQKEPQLAYEQFIERSYRLYERLLQPELLASDSKKLIIIPDGLLSYIPFEVLLTQPIDNLNRDYSKLPYLLRDYAVSYSPSATVKVRSAQDHNTAKGYLGFAPLYEGSVYAEDRKTLSNLQFNTTEVLFASDLFNGKNWTGKLVTEELLKERAKKAGILHLAMHGEVEDEHPLLSRLYFNPSQQEDGMLYMYEVYNMSIPSQLVILSACNTASGKLERGEGILSLERAFQYAGSRSLLSTLWTVDDAASAQLTQNFLENLKAGKTNDVALQEAKIQYLTSATPNNQHPFYWSSFKLTGNTDVLSLKSCYNYLWLGLGVLGLIGVLYFTRKRAA